MIQDAIKIHPKIDVAQFRSLEEEQQYRYICGQLHLDFYSDCSGEVLDDGRRFIGLVKRETAADGDRYYAYPIDCLDENESFKRITLFKDVRSWSRARIPGQNRRNIAAAQRACEEIDPNGWGQRMVSVTYRISPRNDFLWVSDVRVLDLSPAEMHERIREICAKVKTLAGAISQLEARRQELEQQREELEQQREKQREELEHELENQQEARRQLELVLEEKAGREKELSALNAAACALAGRLREYGLEVDQEALGLSLPGKETPEQEPIPDERRSIPDLTALAAQVRSAISQDQKLYYEEHIIREFLGAMFTGQIIILSGPPGTGKSSLPPAIARCIGAECRMVSVQPSWTDNQDLLGFYDPTRERFAATPFLDILVEARNDPNTIYLVCLDEMNLVRVEYYFSEILSAMETESRELRLYSPYAHDLRRKTLKRQLGALSALEPSSERVEKLHTVQDALKLLDRYEAVFPLPDNVQFVGTLNMDETTKGLSPKVLDRSFVIEIDRRAEPAGEASRGLINSFVPSAFREGISCPLPEGGLEDRKQELEDRMAELEKQWEEECLRKVSASLSARRQTHVEKLFCRGLKVDDVLLGKVLSAMRYTEPELDGLIQKQTDAAHKRLGQT